MSLLTDSLMNETSASLETMAGDLANGFLGGMEEILKDADEAARQKVADLVRQGFALKQKAMTATDQDLAREYAEAVETTIRRVRTVLVTEQLVASENIATLIANLFSEALSGLATVAKGILVAVASGIVSGAVQGLIGGDADPSGIFPGV